MTKTQFIRQILTDSDFTHIQIRGRADAIAASGTFGTDVRELRTRKHDLQAIAFDTLGNATVLDPHGNVQQLIGAEAGALPR